MRLLFAWVLMLLAMIGLRLIAPPDGAAPPALEDALGRTFSPPPPGLVGAATALGFLLLGAWLTGSLFRYLQLPRITGYLLFGVLVGPEAAALLPEGAPTLITHDQMHYLHLIEALAISLIALTAGGEIRVELLRRGVLRVVLITVISVVMTFIGVAGGLWALDPLLSLPGDGSGRVTIIVCALIGAIAIANSPAALIAVMQETRASGPMTQTALIVTVLRDLCLVIVFTVLLTVTVNVLSADMETQVERGTSHMIGEVAWHLLGSIGVGAAIGTLMRYAVTRIGEQTIVFIVAVGLGIALLSDALHLESLLVALTAGFVLANVWPQRSTRLFHAVERLSLPVYCVFFAAAGTKIHLDALGAMWPAALVIVGLRAAMIFTGTWLGAKLGGMPVEQRRWLWTCFLAQAGVSIALAATLAHTFAEYEWGAKVASLVLAAVAIHELIGPVLMRIGIIRADEANRDSP